jgi:hypothetical protein
VCVRVARSPGTILFSSFAYRRIRIFASGEANVLGWPDILVTRVSFGCDERREIHGAAVVATTCREE